MDKHSYKSKYNVQERQCKSWNWLYFVVLHYCLLSCNLYTFVIVIACTTFSQWVLSDCQLRFRLNEICMLGFVCFSHWLLFICLPFVLDVFAVWLILNHCFEILSFPIWSWTKLASSQRLFRVVTKICKAQIPILCTQRPQFSRFRCPQLAVLLRFKKRPNVSRI